MIRIASVPSAHPYVVNLDSPHGQAQVHRRLPDPRPPGAVDDRQWWPPRFLEPDWLVGQLDSFDLLHLHFGFDTTDPWQLSAVTEILKSAGKPLIFTLHDLHNPHFVDDTLHRAQLDVLVSAADELLTLTGAAARQIDDRWGVRARVVPHPNVAPLSRIGRARPTRTDYVIGVHAKGLRANTDPFAVLETVVAAADAVSATVRLDIDNDHRPDPRCDGLLGWAAAHGVDVRVHPRFDDDQLWHYLEEIDLSVLPYRFGTHSGWLEACFDLGTAVVAPIGGCYADQQPCFGYVLDRTTFVPDSLVTAIVAAHASRQSTPKATLAGRARTRTEIATAHTEIYRNAASAVAGVSNNAGR